MDKQQFDAAWNEYTHGEPQPIQGFLSVILKHDGYINADKYEYTKNVRDHVDLYFKGVNIAMISLDQVIDIVD